MDKRTPNTSLERSHSTASNLKLTLLCLVSAISGSAAWVFIGLVIYMIRGGNMEGKSWMAISGSVVSFILTFLSLKGLDKFTR
ncbi:MAG: hypothetical protein J6Z46_08320 [Lachnospiraceae bacterium]|nr:hypothetical protein [Lachnospiraceae bacterium]MBP5249991.1 hypothetical protein [Lachnospiraceae bacterium]